MSERLSTVLAAGLFGRHVGGRTDDRAHRRGMRGERGRIVPRRAGRFGAQRFGETEVQDLRRAVRTDFDVRRLKIAVDDPVFVCRFERLRDLSRDRERLLERHESAGDPPGQVFTLDELHHKGRDAVGVFQSIDGRDVRMIQRGKDFSFALKAGQPVRVPRQRRREDLDGDLPFQFRIRRAIDLAHPPRSQRGEDLVRADARAWGEGQGSPQL